MRRPPTGPLVVSVMILAGCAGYLLTRPESAAPLQSGFLDPPGTGVVRIVTWNVGRGDGDSGAPLSAEAIRHVAGVLNRFAPSAVLLQGLVSETDSAAIRAALSGEWVGQSVLRRRGGGQRLGIFVRRSDKPLDRALINTAVGDRALAYDVGDTNGVACRFICMHADSADAERRRRYCDDVLDWLERRRPALTVLGGDLGVDIAAASKAGGSASDRGLQTAIGRMGELLVNCGPTGVATTRGGRRVDYVFVTPNSGTIRSAVVDGARWSTMPHLPIVVDLVP